MSDDYKAALRMFLAEKGQPVQFVEGWGGEPEVSTYGWVDYDKMMHARVCGWVIPEGAILTEQTYSQFGDTNAGNHDEVGLNVTGASCKCGEYTDVTLRYQGSFEEVLWSILGGVGERPHLVL